MESDQIPQVEAESPEVDKPVSDLPRRVLTTGSRLAILAGVLFWMVAGAVLFIPTSAPGDNGTVINCGSGINPETNPLTASRCGPSPEQHRVVGFWLLFGGIVVAAGGVAAFGMAEVEDRHR